MLLLFKRSINQRGPIDCGRVWVPRVAGVANGGVKVEPVKLGDAQNLNVENSVTGALVKARRINFPPHGAAGLFEDVCPGVCLLLVAAVKGVPAWAAGSVVDSAGHSTHS